MKHCQQVSGRETVAFNIVCETMDLTLAITRKSLLCMQYSFVTQTTPCTSSMHSLSSSFATWLGSWEAGRCFVTSLHSKESPHEKNDCLLWINTRAVWVLQFSFGPNVKSLATATRSCNSQPAVCPISSHCQAPLNSGNKQTAFMCHGTPGSVCVGTLTGKIRSRLRTHANFRIPLSTRDQT